MTMIETNLRPAILQLHFDGQTREVTSMSDFVHDGRPHRISDESARFEPRLLFCTCYVLFLLRAVAKRLMRRRGEDPFHNRGPRESIFREAWSAASVTVASSFMGL